MAVIVELQPLCLLFLLFNYNSNHSSLMSWLWSAQFLYAFVAFLLRYNCVLFCAKPSPIFSQGMGGQNPQNSMYDSKWRLHAVKQCNVSKQTCQSLGWGKYVMFCRSGVVAQRYRRRTCDHVADSIQGWALLRNDCGQVVHTQVTKQYNLIAV